MDLNWFQTELTVSIQNLLVVFLAGSFIGLLILVFELVVIEIIDSILNARRKHKSNRELEKQRQAVLASAGKVIESGDTDATSIAGITDGADKLPYKEIPYKMESSTHQDIHQDTTQLTQPTAVKTEKSIGKSHLKQSMVNRIIKHKQNKKPAAIQATSDTAQTSGNSTNSIPAVISPVTSPAIIPVLHSGTFPPPRWYYFVDSSPNPFQSLKSAANSLGLEMDRYDYNHLPRAYKTRIRREPIPRENNNQASK